MKITVVAVGKLTERFWADACEEYAKRLSAYATVKMVEIADRDPAKSGGEETGRSLEGKGILITRGGGFNWPEPDHYRIDYLPPMEVLHEAMEDARMWCCSTSAVRSVQARKSPRIWTT